MMAGGHGAEARHAAWVLALTAGGLLVFASVWVGWRIWGHWDDAQWFTVIGTGFLLAAWAAERIGWLQGRRR